jgi:quinol monooxygenase YgiN/predicted enzyme related to lactoylglutathione lyase
MAESDHTGIRQLARYQVRPDALDDVLAAIREFVAHVRAHEPGTLRYDVWQELDDPTRFVHNFIFRDAEAHQAHSDSAAVKKFAAALYPNCLSPVEFVDYGPVASNAGPPTLANGKICYLEIPATDVDRSSEFYSAVFGWRIRRRGDGHLAFDDATGEVSGTWVTGREPLREPGLLAYIMVGSVAATIESVLAHCGKLVQAIGGDAPEITARFRDPGGNVIGLYQEPEGSGD